MIRWKQAQVHKERQERKDQFDLLSLEASITDKFLVEMPVMVEKALASDALMESLQSLKTHVEQTYTEPIKKESMQRINNWPQNWDAPNWGSVLTTHVPWHDYIENMIITKVSQSSKEDDVRAAFNSIVHELEKRQKLIRKQLDVLDKEMNKHLTVDHLKTGFDSTRVVPKRKETDDEFVVENDVSAMTAAPAADSNASHASKKTIQTIHSPSQKRLAGFGEPVCKEIAAYEGLDLDVLRSLQADENYLHSVSPNLLAFSYATDPSDSARLLRKDPKLGSEKAEEALMMRAIALGTLGKYKDAKTCIVNSLTIKYTRSLGPSGIDVFFSKIQGGKESAQSLFYADVDKSFQHIQTRSKILRAQHIADHEKLLKERAEHESKLVDTYNKFKLDDGSLKFPLDDDASDRVREIAAWFDALPQFAKEGLLLEDIDKINEYLNSVDPKQAEKDAQYAIEAGFIHVQDDEVPEEENSNDVD